MGASKIHVVVQVTACTLFLLLPPEGTGHKLEFASVVFRHGDRSPVASFPKSRHPLSYWPQGPGQLTQLGMQQEYHLGKILRHRYVKSGFIHRNYTRDQVYVRSTDRDRTLMSGQCVLANLFPPGPEQQFTSNLSWQPIPIHTVSECMDKLLLFDDVECPVYQDLLSASTSSSRSKGIEKENADLFEFLSQKTGIKKFNLSMIWDLEDALFVEHSHNLTGQYPWFNETLLHKLMNLTNYKMGLLYDSDTKKKVAGGLYAAKVIDQMKNISSSNNKDSYKLYLYSSHDTTVAAMLNVFGMYNYIQPEYSSAYIIELYSNNSDYFVEFYYRNATSTDDIVQLSHPNCTTPCKLDTLIEVMKPFAITIDQWQALCGLDNDVTSSKYSPLELGLSLAVGVLGIILIAVFVCSIVWCLYKQRRKISYRRLVQIE